MNIIYELEYYFSFRGFQCVRLLRIIRGVFFMAFLQSRRLNVYFIFLKFHFYL